MTQTTRLIKTPFGEYELDDFSEDTFVAEIREKGRAVRDESVKRYNTWLSQIQERLRQNNEACRLRMIATIRKYSQYLMTKYNGVRTYSINIHTHEHRGVTRHKRATHEGASTDDGGGDGEPEPDLDCFSFHKPHYSHSLKNFFRLPLAPVSGSIAERGVASC